MYAVRVRVRGAARCATRQGKREQEQLTADAAAAATDGCGLPTPIMYGRQQKFEDGEDEASGVAGLQVSARPEH